MLLKFGIYGRYNSWKKLVAINWRDRFPIKPTLENKSKTKTENTGEGLLICCQNSQNIIEETDVTFKNT